MKRFMVLFILLAFGFSFGQMPAVRLSFDGGYKYFTDDAYEVVYNSSGTVVYGGSAFVKAVPISDISALYASFEFLSNSADGTAVKMDTWDQTEHSVQFSQQVALYGLKYAWRKNLMANSISWVGLGYARSAVSETSSSIGLSFDNTCTGWYAEYGYTVGLDGFSMGLNLLYTGLTMETDGGVSEGSANLGGLSIVGNVGFAF